MQTWYKKSYMHVSASKVQMTGMYQITVLKALISVGIPLEIFGMR